MTLEEEIVLRKAEVDWFEVVGQNVILGIRRSGGRQRRRG